MQIHPRETVILADDPRALADWYHTVLGLEITRSVEVDYHYHYLESPQGVRIGIADAREMGVTPGDRKSNTVLLQLQVHDVRAFFEQIRARGATTTFGPSHDVRDDFWYGGFLDLEGNPIWVVDSSCPQRSRSRASGGCSRSQTSPRSGTVSSRSRTPNARS